MIIDKTAGRAVRLRSADTVKPGDRNVMDLNRQIDEEMGEDGDKE